ncbi:putative DNA helicase-like protein, partial [Pseudoloma neurophilia]
LRKRNTVARSHRNVREQVAILERNGVNLDNYWAEWRIRGRTQEAGRHNAPLVEETAILFNQDDEGGLQNVCLAVNVRERHDAQSIFIPPTLANNDLMCYPLLYPSGLGGWQENEYKYTSPRGGLMYVSLRVYKRYMYHYRPGRGLNWIFYCGKLLQQSSVDAYVQIETKRIDYLIARRLHPKYVDSNLWNEHGEEGERMGVRFKLPCDFIGSAANMRKRFWDTMVVCTRF